MPRKQAAQDMPTSNIARRRAEAKRGGNPEYEQRRAQVMAAASEAIRVHGYQAMRLSQVSDLLGGDRATIYYYFSGKKDLFLALVSEAAEQNAAMAERIRDSDGSPLERIREIVKSAVMSFEEYPGLSLMALEDDRTLEAEPAFKELRGTNSRFTEALRSLLQEAIADGTATVITPRTGSLMIMGGLNWVNRWYRSNHALSVEEVADEVADFVIGGLTSPRSRRR